MQLQVELILINFCRFQSIDIGSYLCDMYTYEVLSYNFDSEPRLIPEDIYSKRAQRYSRVKWFQQQSLCYENQAYADLTPTLTDHVLCYGFNMDQDMFDNSM